ncbi:hypothetical protein D7V91_11590 [bacterium 1xD42-67]|nr:hypothetical protein D7V91_11590 [bacterium 1xD42-67]
MNISDTLHFEARLTDELVTKTHIADNAKNSIACPAVTSDTNNNIPNGFCIIDFCGVGYFACKICYKIHFSSSLTHITFGEMRHLYKKAYGLSCSYALRPILPMVWNIDMSQKEKSGQRLESPWSL